MEYLIEKTTQVRVEAHSVEEALEFSGKPEKWVDELPPEYKVTMFDPDEDLWVEVKVGVTMQKV